MDDYRLSDLLDMGIIQKMADAHYRAAGMPIGIIDAMDGSILVGAGWQDICVKFHRADQRSRARCRESDDYIKDHLVRGEACRYKCKNGLWDIGIPIVVAGRHLATMFLGQFFYEGEIPDRNFFSRQAREFDYKVSDYLAALDRVPVFDHDKVDYILEYDKALVDFIADLAEHSLFKIKADAKIRENERKFHAVFDQAYQFIGLLTTDGRMVEANSTYLRFGGIEEEDAIGQFFWDTPWWGHSQKLQDKLFQAVREAARGELARFEASQSAADGTLRYVDFSLKPVKDDHDGVVMVVAEGRDITERKQVVNEIKQQSRFLQVLIDAMPYPVFYKDRQGLYLGCNTAFERFYGISRDRITGKSVHDIAPPELADKYQRADEELFAHPGMQIYEGCIQSRQGTRHDVLFHKATFTGPDGEVAGLVGAVVDITERRQAEMALQESESKYRTLVEKSLVGVYVIQDDLFKFVNNRYCEMIGYSSEELVDRINPADLIHPEDRIKVRDNIRKRIRGELDSLEYHIRAIRKDGSIITLRVHGGRMLFQGRPAIMGTVIDITESEKAKRALEESEAKIRSILENIGIGVALISPDMEILDLNRRMREWFPDINLRQRPICYQAFNEPPRAEVCDYCPTCKTLQDGQVHEATTETPQPDGTRNYRVVSSPVRSQSGQVTAAIEMVEDITERLSLESQLYQAQKMESVGRLAGGVAHDFNNMLGVIIGHADLVLDQMDPTDPLFPSMEEIQKAAVRSADLTRQLLAFARKQTVAPKVLDLNETVEGMLKMLRRLIGEDIDLVWQPDSDLWPIKMDPSQIDQILANLCVNARDAIEGVGKVTIETRRVTFDGSYCANHPGFLSGDFVMLAVSDDGHGMGEETMEKIFEPFFTTKGRGKGTGLGLATVYGVVKQNKGFINVYSEPWQGSTFKIYLPRHIVRDEEKPKESRISPVAGGDETILVVEDDPAILALTQLMLDKLGYRVLATSSPGEAVSMAREHSGPIHLLLTDVILPEMNGPDLALALTTLHPETKCLFMSGYTGNVIAHHGILGDGINFIQKPFFKKPLAAKIREVLDSD